MNKIEQYLYLIDIAYENYEKWANEHAKTHLYEPYTKEEFINKCKTDEKFSKQWGLKIEERELSLEERHSMVSRITDKKTPTDLEGKEWIIVDNTPYKIPTKIINLYYIPEQKSEWVEMKIIILPTGETFSE